ncbi:hypothetical protein Hokovirus_5_6 [Hokovirus HKV1]|uniref:Uncharacterized protein n=1 Tax=Hokovirus HKV1 TaxID=1977638 RepID=A0A1V0SHK6_9VIRU|nr:hypothetical protein Hokovirus_5_6 [Hokovirus HKV1]
MDNSFYKTEKFDFKNIIDDAQILIIGNVLIKKINLIQILLQNKRNVLKGTIISNNFETIFIDKKIKYFNKYSDKILSDIFEKQINDYNENKSVDKHFVVLDYCLDNINNNNFNTLLFNGRQYQIMTILATEKDLMPDQRFNLDYIFLIGKNYDIHKFCSRYNIDFEIFKKMYDTIDNNNIIVIDQRMCNIYYCEL